MTIIAATDLSQRSQRAIQMAATLAAQQGALLLCLHVIDALEGDDAWRVLFETPAELAEALRVEAHSRVEALVEEALRELPERPQTQLRVEVGDPGEVIAQLAQESGASLIVTGTRGHSALVAAFLGSTAAQLIRQSERPVLVVPPEQPTLHPRILLAPLDLSSCSRASLQRAAQLARALKARVHALHVVTLPTLPVMAGAAPIDINALSLEQLLKARRDWLEHTIDVLGVRDVVGELVVRTGEPAHTIHEVAQELGADLICMGSHGRRGLQRLLLGSTAQRVLRHAPCAVYVLREELHETNAQPA
jgi:nucleotide-binding universal stress UspA family protein